MMRARIVKQIASAIPAFFQMLIPSCAFIPKHRTQM